MRKHLLALVAIALMSSASVRGQAAKRAITLDDHSRITGVGDPQRSPDGQWVAYTVTTIDAEKDRRNTDVWMVKWDGSEQLQLTSSPDNESSPRSTMWSSRRGGSRWCRPVLCSRFRCGCSLGSSRAAAHR